MRAGCKVSSDIGLTDHIEKSAGPSVGWTMENAMKRLATFCIDLLIRWLTLVGAAAVFNLLVPFPVTWGLVSVFGIVIPLRTLSHPGAPALSVSVGAWVD